MNGMFGCHWKLCCMWRSNLWEEGGRWVVVNPPGKTIRNCSFCWIWQKRKFYQKPACISLILGKQLEIAQVCNTTKTCVQQPSSDQSNLRTHLKMHSWEKPNEFAEFWNKIKKTAAIILTISQIFKLHRLMHLMPMHNVHILHFLYLATEQAGTFLQSPLVWHHLTYINPRLFSCKINIENIILVSFKL